MGFPPTYFTSSRIFKTVWRWGDGMRKSLGNQVGNRRLGLWEDLVPLPLGDPRHPTQEGTPCGLVKSLKP